SSIHTPSLIGTYSLSLHDALPIYVRGLERPGDLRVRERTACVSRMVARAVCEARIEAVGEWPGTMAQLGYPPPDFRAHRLRSSNAASQRPRGHRLRAVQRLLGSRPRAP